MFGISNFFGSYDDGYINCEFKRPTDIRINDDNIPANINRFQLLKDKYVVFLAEGTFRNGQILKHRVKDASAEPLVKFSGHFFRLFHNFQFFFQPLGIAVNLEAKSNVFLRLHGAFMIGAWLGSASLGILVARYFKQTWTGAQCCKKDVWFVIHR